MENLIKAAKIVFSSTFSFYLKAQNFHWNVEGPDFLEYHDLFGKIYEEVYGSVDKFAENIRGLGSYSPGGLQEFLELTKIQDQVEMISKEEMVSMLLEDNQKMLALIKVAYSLSEQEGEYGFSNFLAERMDAHRKHGWMLTASLRGV